MKRFRMPHKRNLKKIIGVVLGVTGAIVIIQVVPLTAWFFLLGLLLIALGWTFFKML